MQASVRDLGEVVVLIVVADIVCERIQRPIVAICLLALQARALCRYSCATIAASRWKGACLEYCQGSHSYRRSSSTCH